MVDISTAERYLDSALRFTETHRKLSGEHIAVREAECCRCLYPAVLNPIRETDLFAGGLLPIQGSPVFADFSSQKSNQSGYSMNIYEFRRARELFPEKAGLIDDAIEYWLRETTFMKFRKRAEETDDADIRAYIGRFSRHLDGDGYAELDIDTPDGEGDTAIHIGTRLAGITLDYKKLLTLGINGLEDEIRQKAGGDCDEEAGALYSAMLISLQNVREVCLHYRAEALEKARSCADDVAKNDLSGMAETLGAISRRAPESFREAVQLFWLYSVMCRAGDYGRLDVTLGTFLCRDLDSGSLSYDEAKRYLLSLWKLMDETEFKWNERIILGGRGRENEADADRFALLAMEVTSLHHRIMPVLTLRLYDGQNPALYEKAIDVIGTGALYPTLYNDEVIIPGQMKAMDIPEKDALDYVPLGCGEMMVEKKSVGSPDGVINICKALEAALHNGCDGRSGERIGEATGEPETLDTYEKLLEAFERQLSRAIRTDARTQRLICDVTSGECSFVLQSILLDDCIEKGRAMLKGGLRYLGGTSEGFGQTNAADSLYAIKKLVYEDKKLPLRELVSILDRNFEGYENARALMTGLPKYGNDRPEVDEIVRYIEEAISRECETAGKDAGLHYYTVSSVNPNGIKHGRQTCASADGRHRGEAFAIGDSPSPGADKSGFTAMLSSVAGSRADNGGYITNIKLSKQLINEHRKQLTDALCVFWESGGQQLNITVVSREELEDAVKHPENYGNLLVRVGGYSARFVELSPVFQKHIIERTLY